MCWYKASIGSHSAGRQNSHFLTISNTLRSRQSGRHFPDDIFKWIFVNKDAWISIKISLKFVPRSPINNISALVQIIAWRWPGDKPLSEPMLRSLLEHSQPCTRRVKIYHLHLYWKCFSIILWRNPKFSFQIEFHTDIVTRKLCLSLMMGNHFIG